MMKNNSKNWLWEIIKSNSLTHEIDWLLAKSALTEIEIMTAFVAAPRFLQKIEIPFSYPMELGQDIQIPWSFVRICRVWLLLELESASPENFNKNIETLFDTAEMNELVALYSALPFWKEPQHWLFRATDAVRSNMGLVFDAIALGNPFPAEHFSEAAWNQLILKTIFNDKPIHLIAGFKERENEILAKTISDFAHERWAAGRAVAPEVWRLTAAYIDESLLKDMEHLLRSTELDNQKAAALACSESSFEAAKVLLNNYPDLKLQIQQGSVAWSDLEYNDLNTYVSQP
jgi:hypothetical protein